MNTRYLFRYAYIAVIAVSLGSVVAVLHAYHPPRHTVAIHALLPNGDSVEYGWLSTYRKGTGGIDNYYSFMRWNHGKRVKTYLIFAGYERPVSGNAELRARKDYTGVWLLNLDEVPPEVVATLDMETGVFLDANRCPRDSRLPLAQQETDCAIQPYPIWATRNEGIVVGQWKDHVRGWSGFRWGGRWK
ncbi:MAG: hypothetical protein ACYC0V_18965 [Armatimonadota bacterium]